MAITKNLHPAEARRCAAEAETIVWAMILVMVALTVFGAFLFLVAVKG